MDGPNGIEASKVSKLGFDCDSIVCGHDVQVVAERDLKKLTQGPLRSFLQSPDENIEKKLQLWNCLLHTFAVPQISSGHRTAICNAISAFLEFSSKVQDEALRNFALSEETWFSVFTLFLDRYEDGRPKPMKQVLTTLGKLLIEHPDRDVAHSIRARAVHCVVPTIVLFQPRSRLKAALHALEWFLRKGAMSALDAIAHTEEWLWESHGSWVPLLKEHCTDLRIPIASLVDPDVRLGLPREDVRAYAAQILCVSLLLNARSEERSLTSGALLCQICSKVALTQPQNGLSAESSMPFWVAPLKYIAMLNFDAIEGLSNHVFHPLFKANTSNFKTFLGVLPFEEMQSNRALNGADTEVSLLFSILETGKELGLVQEEYVPGQKSGSTDWQNSTVILEATVFRDLLVHPDPDTRISALSLLVFDPSTTKPLSSSTLFLLREALPYIHADNDPHSRGEFLSLLRRLLIRLRGGSNLRLSEAEIEKNHSEARAFLSWYMDFLESELHPCASYQTHITALKVLILFLQSGLDSRLNPAHLSRIGQEQQYWHFHLDVFRPSLLRAAGDLLSDPFDDVRSSAFALLRLFPVEFLTCSRVQACGGIDLAQQTGPTSRFWITLKRAEDTAARTGRADHADTVARLYHILFDLADSPSDRFNLVDGLLAKLEQHVSSSDETLRTALRSTPVHGHIAALRYIVGTPNFHAIVSTNSTMPAWRVFHERIVTLCDRVWDAVRPVLCVDSPECEQDTSNEQVVGPKDMLSCSWRALRESSLLLHAILSNRTYAPSTGEDVFGYEDYSRIGKLSFVQLAELRHRGAFSTVSQTFASCCQRCGQSKDPAIVSLPESWYNDILTIIDDQAAKLTRRSAGIPALVTGVASSCVGTPFFQRIIDDLQNIANSPANENTEEANQRLPQVHALNCLKDMFMNTLLGPSTEKYIVSALNISADCLGSPIWAIRNCGLMLYRSLMTRMCRPTTGARVSLTGPVTFKDRQKIYFHKYPNLIPLLSGLLGTPVPRPKPGQTFDSKAMAWELSITTERVFPALELIGNKISSASEDDSKLRQLTFGQTGNPVWGIRDHAARVYASLVSRKDVLDTALQLSDVGSSVFSENQVHGRILCIRYLLQRLWASPLGYWRGSLDIAASVISQVVSRLGRHASSPFSQASLVEILNDALEASVQSGEEDVLLSGFTIPLDRFLSLLDRFLAPEPQKSTSRASSLLIRALASLVTFTRTLKQDSAPGQVYSTLEAVSNTDQDAAPAALDRLQGVLESHEPSQAFRIQLYASVIHQTQSHRMRQAAISGLASVLEVIFDKSSEMPEALRRLTSLAGVLEQTAADRSGNRDLVNAVLHLQGCILPLRLESREDLSNLTIQTDLQKLVQRIAFAMQDETEFTTRLSAVLSMKCLLGGLRLLDVQFHSTPSLIEALFVLYDMLNDDDDELRDIAAEAASKILATNGSVIARLPLASSVELSKFLCTNYNSQLQVFEGGVRRLLGRIHSRDMFVPVATTLRELRQGTTALFEEEKQNLYIDDVREVQVWSSVLTQLQPDPSNALSHAFHSWVTEGLDALVDVVREEEADGMLGFTSKPDVYVTGVRVVRSAETLLRTQGYRCSGFDAELLRKKLELLHAQGERSQLHERWMFLITSALESLPTQTVPSMP
ncbi:hypothetical protein VTO42DRAFT_3034 [Malbranchea cinnamomea]